MQTKACRHRLAPAVQERARPARSGSRVLKHNGEKSASVLSNVAQLSEYYEIATRVTPRAQSMFPDEFRKSDQRTPPTGEVSATCAGRRALVAANF
jgi:hypothetical protein